MSAKAQKPQDYFVYFKVFVTQAGAKFAAKRARGFIQRFPNDFDNLGGGYIFLGIDEKNGRPVFPIEGLNPDAIDTIQKDILNKCNFIEPRYIPIVEPAVIDGRDILVLWIPGGDDRPYKCPEKIYTEKSREKSEKAFYIRKLSNTVKANYLEERELIELARNIPFDDRVNNHAEIADMRSSLLSEYLHAVESELYEGSLSRTVEEVATDMQLVRGPSEYRKPVNAGLMFFNEHPDKFFPYSRIEVVDKPDPTGIGMKERIFITSSTALRKLFIRALIAEKSARKSAHAEILNRL